MRMPTKSLASLLLMTAVAATVPGISKLSRGKRRESQFDRILQHHDRKGELRAEILGISPLELRDLQKKHTFEEIARKHGFRTSREFRLALLGKLKNELHQRGWTPKRIDHYVEKRSSRTN